MMVTVEGSFSSGLSPLLETLEDETSVVDDRVDAYLTLTDRLRNDVKEVMSKEICQKTTNLVSVYQRDMIASSAELSQASLQALGFCIHHQDISRAFSQKDATSLLKALCNTLLATSDKCTCTRALWCIAKQNFQDDVIKSELHSILCAIEHVLVEGRYQSMAVEHESINAIIKLLEQLPETMKTHTLRWSGLVYPLLLHSAHKIRERAAHAMKLGFPALMAHQQEIVKTLVPDLKGLFIQEMTKFFESRQELYVLHIWQYFIDLLGKALHKGGSLINSLLAIVERGFKSTSPEIRCASFQAWQHLIDNFALDMDILCNHKRLKLLLQPFKVTAAKQESIALAKFNAWWHLVQVMGTRLTNNFDQVCVPLLQFSLGLTSVNIAQCPSTPVMGSSSVSRLSTPQIYRSGGGGFRGSPVTPHIDLPGNAGQAPAQSTYKSVQRKGMEILARFLQEANIPVNKLEMEFTVGPLPHQLLSSSSAFTKVGAILISTVRDAFCSIGSEFKESLVQYIWQCLTAHLEALLDLGPKKDTVEIFTLYLTCLQSIINSEKLSSSFTLKLLESVSRLPHKALASPAYHVGNAEVMHGTPALYLIQQLFHHSMLDVIHEERFFCIMDRLVECGINNPTSVLRFAQSILEMLDEAAVAIDNKEMVWRIWSTVVNLLLRHVIQNNEVNQGDSLEHDFSTMYAALTLPVNRIFTYNIAQGTMKTLLKTWSELYRTFARCAALVTTAEANLCCEDLSQRILSIVDEDALMDMNIVDALVQICGVMIIAMDFSQFSMQQAATDGALMSPAKLNRKGHRPLGNLTSVTKLLGNLLRSLCQFTSTKTMSFAGLVTKKSSEENTQPWSSGVSGMMTLLSMMFAHISIATVISDILSKLAEPIANLFAASATSPGPGGLFTMPLNQKLQKLLTDILTAVESRYKRPYDTAFLRIVSPLLEATLHHPKRSLKNRSLVFWNATFANAEHLEYPEGLKLCLQKLKKKTPIVLPGFEDSDIQTVEETPFSLGTDTEASQTMAPPAPPMLQGVPNFGRPSPQKMHGSFLRKTPTAVASPKSTASPSTRSKSQKGFASPLSATARRKLPLSIDEDSMEFVKIAPSPKKKRVLTEHQKEVLRNRSVVPAMYNDLDASQDTNLMAELMASQSVQDSQISLGEEPEQCNQKPDKDDEKGDVAPTSEDVDLSSDEDQEVFEDALSDLGRKEIKRVSFSGLIEEAKSDVDSVCGQSESTDEKRVGQETDYPNVNHFQLFSDVRDYDDDDDGSGDGEMAVKDAKKRIQPELVMSAMGVSVESSEVDGGDREKTGGKITSEEDRVDVDKREADGDCAVPECENQKLGEEGVADSVGIDSVEEMDISTTEESEKYEDAVGLNTTSEDVIAGTPPKENAVSSVNRRRSLGVLVREGKIKTEGTSIEVTDTSEKPASEDMGDAAMEESAGGHVISLVPETQSMDFGAESELDFDSKPDIIAVADSQAEERRTRTHPKESTGVVPGSGDSQKLMAEPVLKLKRLSQDDIKKYSPKKNKATKSVSSPLKTRGSQCSAEQTEKGTQSSVQTCEDGQNNKAPERKSKRRRSIIRDSSPLGRDADSEGIDGVAPLPADREDDGDDAVMECGEASHDGSNKAASKGSGSGRDKGVDSQDAGSGVFTQNPERKLQHTKTEEKTDSSPQLSQEAELKPKRKRGRPPLIKNRKSLSSTDETLDDGGNNAAGKRAESQDYAGDVSSQEVSPARKKKLGIKTRLRKSEETSPRAGAESEREPTPKRKPGRPPKGTKPPSLSTVAEVTEASSREGGSSGSQRPVRRRVSKYGRRAADNVVPAKSAEGEADSSRDTASGSRRQGPKDEASSVHNMSTESVDLFASQKDTEVDLGPEGDGDEVDKTGSLVAESGNQDRDRDPVERPNAAVASSPEQMNVVGGNEPDANVDVAPHAGGVESEAIEDSSAGDSTKPSGDADGDAGRKDALASAEDGDVRDSTHSAGTASEAVTSSAEDGNLLKDPTHGADTEPGVASPTEEVHTGDSAREADSNVAMSREEGAKEEAAHEEERDGEATFKDCDGAIPPAAGGKAPSEARDVSDGEEKRDNRIDSGKLKRLVGKKKTSPKQKAAKKVLQRVVKSPVRSPMTTRRRKLGGALPVARRRTASASPVRQQSLEDKREEQKPKRRKSLPSAEVKENLPGKEERVREEVKKVEMEEDDDWDLPLANLVGCLGDESKMDEPVVSQSESKDGKEPKVNTVTKTDGVERLESGQSPPKPAAKSNNPLPGKEARFSSPHSSPVSSRRFVFPRLANLSPSSSSDKPGQRSPKGMVTSPAQLRLTSQLYSPKTSPGGGILKRKCTDSPSPPNKLRRVSFAEPLEQEKMAEECNSPGQKGVNRCLELNKSALPPSPLVTTTPSKVITAQSRYITTPLRESGNGRLIASGYRMSPVNGGHQERNGFITPTSNNRGKRRLSRTPQSSPASVKEDEWDSREQVYPELNDCPSPVEQVLPQLTSSVLSRGLGQLVRARKIHTVGNLCSLTCAEVQNLPIRSPKVQTIKMAMDKFEKQLKRTKSSTRSSAPTLPSTENISKSKALDNRKEREVATVLEDSGQLLDEINKLSQSGTPDSGESCEKPVEQGVDCENGGRSSSDDRNQESASKANKKSDSESNADVATRVQERMLESEAVMSDDLETTRMDDAVECPSGPKRPRLMERLGELADEFTEENLGQLSSEEIFAAHQQVNAWLSAVVGALKSKCK